VQYVFNLIGKMPAIGKISKGNMEWPRDEEREPSTCVWHGVLSKYPKAVSKEIRHKMVFDRIIGYRNDKHRYQVYVPHLKTTVHSHNVYFKPERVRSS